MYQVLSRHKTPTLGKMKPDVCTVPVGVEPCAASMIVPGDLKTNREAFPTDAICGQLLDYASSIMAVQDRPVMTFATNGKLVVFIEFRKGDGCVLARLSFTYHLLVSIYKSRTDFFATLYTDI